jgi:leucyl/phenylalanyl-tRNA--protein transferase
MAGFTADDLIECYRRGVFPMAETRSDREFFLVDPARRGVLPLAGFHVPARLARRVRADPFEIRIDTAFAEVVAACAQATPQREETWISRPIERLYGELFSRGVCHSVEAWRDGRLVGGLYGVSIGAAFFGESMFSRETDASKVALVHLVGRLIVGGYELLDTQFVNDHLTQFGVLDIAKADYHTRLDAALQARGDFYELAAGACGAVVLQAITQAS